MSINVGILLRDVKLKTYVKEFLSCYTLLLAGNIARANAMRVPAHFHGMPRFGTKVFSARELATMHQNFTSVPATRYS